MMMCEYGKWGKALLNLIRLVMALASDLLLAFVAMNGWNLAMAGGLGLPELGFWPAVAICLVVEMFLDGRLSSESHSLTGELQSDILIVVFAYGYRMAIYGVTQLLLMLISNLIPC